MRACWWNPGGNPPDGMYLGEFGTDAIMRARIVTRKGIMTDQVNSEKRLVCLPRCPHHQTEMVLREQTYCGIWYDCHEPQCRCSVLIMSEELMDYYESCGVHVKPNYNTSVSEADYD
jgi:hypothetical protein